MRVPKNTTSVIASQAVSWYPTAGSSEFGGSDQTTFTVPPYRPPETGCGPGTYSWICTPPPGAVVLVAPFAPGAALPVEQPARPPAVPTTPSRPAAPVSRRKPRRSVCRGAGTIQRLGSARGSGDICCLLAVGVQSAHGACPADLGR